MDLKRRLRDGRHRLWLGLARRGNEDAFRRLYDELYGPVAGYVAGRVANPQDAEDLTGTVFFRLVDGLDRFDGRRGSVLTWLLAVARNLARVAGTEAPELLEVEQRPLQPEGAA